MLRKRRSPKRRASLQVVSNLALPAIILDWEWELLMPLLCTPAPECSTRPAEPPQPEVDHEAR
jgi:hypothetical protein